MFYWELLFVIGISIICCCCFLLMRIPDNIFPFRDLNTARVCTLFLYQHGHKNSKIKSFCTIKIKFFLLSYVLVSHMFCLSFSRVTEWSWDAINRRIRPIRSWGFVSRVRVGRFDDSMWHVSTELPFQMSRPSVEACP